MTGAVCPECGLTEVHAVAIPVSFNDLSAYPGLECESCGWCQP